MFSCNFIVIMCMLILSCLYFYPHVIEGMEASSAVQAQLSSHSSNSDLIGSSQNGNATSTVPSNVFYGPYTGEFQQITDSDGTQITRGIQNSFHHPEYQGTLSVHGTRYIQTPPTETGTGKPHSGYRTISIPQLVQYIKQLSPQQRNIVLSRFDTQRYLNGSHSLQKVSQLQLTPQHVVSRSPAVRYSQQKYPMTTMSANLQLANYAKNSQGRFDVPSSNKPKMKPTVQYPSFQEIALGKSEIRNGPNA